MCYIFGVKVSLSTKIKFNQLEGEIGTLAALDEIGIKADGFWYSNIPVLVANDSGSIDAVSMHWEFIPPWVENWAEMKLIRAGIDPRTGIRKKPIPWFNAKGETLLTGKMFADAARNRRCLIPATHFWEYRHYTKPGNKTEVSYPYYIAMKDKEFFYFAGVWQPWAHDEPDIETNKLVHEVTNTVANVTTVGIPVMKQIHNKRERQPVILPDDLAFEWLMTRNMSDKRITELATYQFKEEDITYHTVSKQYKKEDDPTAYYKFEDLPDIVTS